MNLLQALAKTDIRWSLEKSARPYAHNPARTEHTMLLRVALADGADTMEMHFRVDTTLTTEQMVSTFMKKHMRQHPALREWLDSKGNVPVELDIGEEDFKYIGNPMHTGLRKLADSKQSVITWNTLHKLHSDDNRAIWATAADVVRKAFNEAAKAGRKPIRRQLATQLRDAITELVDRRRFEPAINEAGREEKRTELEVYALNMMYAGVGLTDIDEWMWGWLGYVVKDAESETAGNVEEAA